MVETTGNTRIDIDASPETVYAILTDLTESVNSALSVTKRNGKVTRPARLLVPSFVDTTTAAETNGMLVASW